LSGYMIFEPEVQV